LLLGEKRRGGGSRRMEMSRFVLEATNLLRLVFAQLA
jgi:hypothetical protein